MMLCAHLPRYTGAPKLANGKPADPDAPALTFASFVADVLGWVRWWNSEHTMSVLDGSTPLQAWADDPTPVEDVPEADLVLYTLEDDGRTRKITTKGVSFRGRAYVADWMTGRVGDLVRVRWMPHHERDIEVFDAGSGAHLGGAYLSDQATREEIAAMLRARATQERRTKADLRKVAKDQRVRYAATTTASPPQAITAVSSAKARAAIADGTDEDLARLARFDLLAPSPPPPGWVLPRSGDAEPDGPQA